MNGSKRLGVLALFLAAQTGIAQAADDFMQFYKEEAQVVSASRTPQPANQVPATVHVVTQEDIKASGALNIWDALRGVAGVDVVETRTGQGEVSIRGLDRPVNNRVLVMIDGRSVLNEFFDHVVWESLPVHLEEVDRIEIVEGPASAVYGANALAGVVNIITKTPEALNGGLVSYTGGERNTQISNVTYGKKQGAFGYKFGGGWHSTDQFQDASQFGSQSGHFSSLLGYDFSDHSSLSLSGGFSQYNTDLALGIGTMIDKGMNSYMRANYVFRDTKFQSVWSHLRSDQEQSLLMGDTNMDYDAYDFSLEQAVSLPFHNRVVFGGSYHRTNAQSPIMADPTVSEDRWSAFAENKWEIAPKWMLTASGRVDRHPLTPLRFSPRGSLLYLPVPEHVFRVSAGTSFRNPTLVESYLNRTYETPLASPPNPPGFVLDTQVPGSRTLQPESLESKEVGYTGRFGRWKTDVTGYHYIFKNPISPGNVTQLGVVPPVVTIATPFGNNTAFLRAWGGEGGVEYVANSWLRLFGNYSYIYTYGANEAAAIAMQSPRHKANTGFRTKNGGLTTQWQMHWVDKTNWAGEPISAYFLVNARVGYAFSGRLSGLEAAVNAFNLLNHDHYEGPTGYGSQIVRSRLSGTLAYKF